MKGLSDEGRPLAGNPWAADISEVANSDGYLSVNEFRFSLTHLGLNCWFRLSSKPADRVSVKLRKQVPR